MTRALRMALRATGQIGILATTVNMTVLTAGLLTSRLVYVHWGGEHDDRVHRDMTRGTSHGRTLGQAWR